MNRKGTEMVPFFFVPMEHSTPEAKIEERLLPFLEGTDMFLVSIKIKPVNNIKIFLDADEGLNIAKCASINRKLNRLIEEDGLYPEGDYSIEVSSPGIDEPLTSVRQYMKNIGRTVEVTPEEGNAVTGLLKEVTDDKIVLSIKAEKKKPASEMDIPLSFIKKTVVQITF